MKSLEDRWAKEDGLIAAGYEILDTAPAGHTSGRQLRDVPRCACHGWPWYECGDLVGWNDLLGRPALAFRRPWRYVKGIIE